MLSRFYDNWNLMRATVVVVASLILMAMFIQGHCWEDCECPVDNEPTECTKCEDGEPHFYVEPSAPHERE